jgi:hypothetical protein
MEARSFWLLLEQIRLEMDQKPEKDNQNRRRPSSSRNRAGKNQERIWWKEIWSSKTW